MPEREAARTLSELIESFRQSWPYIWTMALSLFAGVVQYVEKMRNGARFNGKELICDLVICVFVGYLTMLICRMAGIEGDAQSLIIAVSAHMGTRALMQYEAFRNRVLGLPSVKGVGNAANEELEQQPSSIS